MEPLHVAADEVINCSHCNKKKYRIGPPYCCLNSYDEETEKMRLFWKSFEERTEIMQNELWKAEK